MVTRTVAPSGLMVHEGLEFKFSPSLGILASQFDILDLRIRSFRDPLLICIKTVMIPSFRANFQAGGRPAWEPLAEATLKTRAREGSGDAPLVRTGDLLRVMGQINIWALTSTTATIKDLPQSVWYGKVQQAGYQSGIGSEIAGWTGSLEEAIARVKARGPAARTSPDIPARPFVLFQPEDIEKVFEVFDVWLNAKVIETLDL